MITKNKLDEKIESLERELEQLKFERDNNTGLKPSETRALIEKYYGHCFRFEGIEYGSIDMMLDAIHIDREKKEIRLHGNFICYVTPDCSFLSNFDCGLYPYGGSIMCKGSISTDMIPYFPEINWDKMVYKQLDDVLKAHEITHDEFSRCVQSVDENADDVDYMEPLEEIIESHNKGYDYDYKHIFGKL